VLELAKEEVLVLDRFFPGEPGLVGRFQFSSFAFSGREALQISGIGF